MIRSAAHKAKAQRETQRGAMAHVFRDFVRQLEKLDTTRAKPARRGGR